MPKLQGIQRYTLLYRWLRLPLEQPSQRAHDPRDHLVVSPEVSNGICLINPCLFIDSLLDLLYNSTYRHQLNPYNTEDLTSLTQSLVWPDRPRTRPHLSLRAGASRRLAPAQRTIGSVYFTFTLLLTRNSHKAENSRPSRDLSTVPCFYP
jgi:hypothetical protein